MIVISDTTTITNLIHVNQLAIVKKLYGRLLIPGAVYEELSLLPKQKRIIDETEWITTVEVFENDAYNELKNILDIGEVEAIVLSLNESADLLIIDELEGRRVAQKFGVRIIGLLGILLLLLAKRKGFIDAVRPIIDSLMNDFNFRISPKLFKHILIQANEVV